MSNEKGRRQFSPEEKVQLLKRRLVDGEEISRLCEEYKIQPTQFYQWQKEFFERGAAAFERPKTSNKAQSNAERRVAELEAKLAKKNEVLGELMEEHIQLKKNLGEI